MGLSLSLDLTSIASFQRVGGAYDPVASLGSDLIACWDASRADLITQSAGLVSSWKDVVAGYDATQGTGAAQPVYSATGFNGDPGISFDGSDDCLTCIAAGLLAALAVGPDAGDIWAVFSQDAPGSDASVRTIAGYGSLANQFDGRLVSRIAVAAVNRARYRVGTGAAIVLATGSTDLSFRHLIRLRVDAAISQDVDGLVPDGTVAGTTATVAGRVRLGANTGPSANFFHQGQLALVMFTKPLGTGTTKANDLQNYLLTRRRL